MFNDAMFPFFALRFSKYKMLKHVKIFLLILREAISLFLKKTNILLESPKGNLENPSHFTHCSHMGQTLGKCLLPAKTRV